MTSTYESDDDSDRERPETERYVAFDDELGATVVYDTQNNRAWLKSDDAVELEAMA
ncbi:hypothetical protein NGM10_15405 [Halorussus salilacus]|uniref:DUF7331 family protein n=1 Tax=Halorussus salilacus TaxID=2953750 RepID=UPI0020A0C143|nr:hypothetical protein [Halorussus salilacus]USZ68104.1 hypothetical protein NGM10_15405 [Halorussus salilacus]